MTSISVIWSPVWILTGPVEPSTERTMTWALPLNASSFGQQQWSRIPNWEPVADQTIGLGSPW